MSKLVAIASALTVVITLGLSTYSSADDGSGSGSDSKDKCLTTDFKTQLVKDACAKGGQAAAKAAMQAFNKEKKIKSCNQCHKNLKPKYELKDDAVEQYKKLGGK